MNSADKLLEIYERLKRLKQNGVKMKDIASTIEWSPSVLSGLYATVLPAFAELYAGGMNFDEALDEAIYKVNNISRKKLLGDIDTIYDFLTETMPAGTPRVGKKIPFLKQLASQSRLSTEKSKNLEGTYMSYSCSSSVRTLKAEPFYLTHAGDDGHLACGRKSVHGFVREGIAIVKEQQVLYILLNAFSEPNLSLVTVYMQLPFLEEVKILKGLYLVPDYNQNPIARRIVFVKLSDTYDASEFAALNARLIPHEEFTDTEKAIFDYTCEITDSLKMCTLPSPKLDLRDLQAEKTLLRKEAELESSL